MFLPLLLALACSPSEKSADIATKGAEPPAAAGAGKVAGPTSVAGIPEQVEQNGLRSWVLREGTGPAPQPGQMVEVHYTGWLKHDGMKFDSSVDKGEPFTFPLGRGRVIAGWDQGVALMKVGEKRQFEIPPDLGYGSEGIGPIPPGATLIFDVELLAVR